jgi:hypothetical protein
MMMDFSSLNWIAIVVAVVLNMVLGMLWYGPLFGKQWMALTGHTPDPNNKQAMWTSMGGATAASVVLAVVLAWVLMMSGAALMMDAFLVGFLLWLGFIATTLLDQVLFDQKPFALFAINAGFRLVGILVMAGVLTYWA